MLHSKVPRKWMDKYSKLDTPLSKESATDMQEDAHIPVSSRMWLVRT